MAYQQHKFISQSSEGPEVSGQVPAGLGSWQGSSNLHMIAFLIYLHRVERELGSSLVSSYKDNNSILGVPLTQLNYLPKALPPNTVTLGLKFQHKNLGETQPFSP